MAHDVLVDSDRVDSGEAIRVVGEAGEQRPDRVPHGVPIHPSRRATACTTKSRSTAALLVTDLPPDAPHQTVEIVTACVPFILTDRDSHDQTRESRRTHRDVGPLRGGTDPLTLVV
jgi:hypothetical protein